HLCRGARPLLRLTIHGMQAKTSTVSPHKRMTWQMLFRGVVSLPPPNAYPANVQDVVEDE
ncbi:MAG: hypothetical protein ACKPKO_54730, partial [Candidatus Fonsibacter sp.]